METSKQIAIGIVGCGALTELYYAPSLREIERAGLARVASIFDPSPERLAAIGALLPGAKQFADFGEFLKSAPAMAILASPAKFHAPQSIALLEKGAFVLCEKPMAATVDEAEKMMAAAGANQRLAVGLFRRFFPATQLIREYMERGILGKPLRFEFTEGGAFNWPAQSASFFEKKTAHGGVLLDLGVHLLDLALWWFGEPASFEYEDDAMGGLEINSVLRLDYASGLKGVVQLSRDWDLPNRYVIHCEKGWIAWKVGEANQIEIGAQGMTTALKAQVHETKRFAAGKLAPSYAESFVLQLLNCLHAMEGRACLAVPGAEGIRSLRLIEACYGKRQLLRMPWMTKTEMTRAAALAFA